MTPERPLITTGDKHFAGKALGPLIMHPDTDDQDQVRRGRLHCAHPRGCRSAAPLRLEREGLRESAQVITPVPLTLPKIGSF